MLLSFCCCHGDGSDGWHVCTKYHGHMHYYQATMLEIVIKVTGKRFAHATGPLVNNVKLRTISSGSCGSPGQIFSRLLTYFLSPLSYCTNTDVGPE